MYSCKSAYCARTQGHPADKIVKNKLRSTSLAKDIAIPVLYMCGKLKLLCSDPINIFGFQLFKLEAAIGI